MLYSLVQSGISGYPNKTVALQFFETVARYGDFFKVRKDCIVPALQAMVGVGYVQLSPPLCLSVNYVPQRAT